MVELKSEDEIMMETIKKMEREAYEDDSIDFDRIKKRWVNLDDVDELELAFIYQEYKGKSFDTKKLEDWPMTLFSFFKLMNEKKERFQEHKRT